MASHAHAHDSHADHGPQPYILLFFILGALTVIEVIIGGMMHTTFANYIWPVRLALIAIAVVKAVLVALYYMHLKFEKALIYYVCAVPFLFASILTGALHWDINLVHIANY